MPTEFRRIVFTSEELKEALTLYSRTANGPLPPGTVVGCDLKGSGGVQAVVAVSNPRTGELDRVELDAAQLGASLIKFCIEKKIPIPREGTKSIQIAGDDVALRITLGTTEAGLPRDRDGQ